MDRMEDLMRRRSVLLGVATASLAAPALAQQFPTKPVRIVVPYTPGGGADTTARLIAPKLQEALGQTVVIDNKPGAGGTIGDDAVAKAAPDGHTLLIGAFAHAVNPSLMPKMPFRTPDDFAPLSLLVTVPELLVVTPSFPAKTVAELVAMAKAEPGKLSYASSGNGSGLHLSMELLKAMAGIELVHVPYKGAGASVPDLLAGNVQAMFISYGTGSAHIKSGRVRILAVTSAQRSPALPDIPTIAEAGVPGYDSGVWYALLAPKGTPAAIVARLHDESVALLKGKEMSERFAADGIKPIGSTPEELTAYIKSERVKWAAVVKRSGATVD
jgi:tripartite-type tricarboxylate transporter receptor subunit TctC